MMHFLLSTIAILATSASSDYTASVDVGGASIRVNVQQPVTEEKAQQLIEWVRKNAQNIEQVYGRFPNPAPKVVLITDSSRGWGSDQAVQFGQVTRGDGGTVTLYINPDRPIEEFYDDWTATHEFSHLMTPLLDRRYRWITEGMATYYQNVLMARGGQYTEEFAWQRLSEGFERGRQSSPEMSPSEATASRSRDTRMKVYWSGAAFALLADTELRRRSNGLESLDSVLGKLQTCCLPTRRRWSGPQLMRQLDALLDEDLFMPMYRRYANADGFPNVNTTMQQLGVTAIKHGVELRDDTEFSDIRVAIMASSNDR